MSLLFVMNHAPHGSINAQEGLDALLMGSAFSQCSVLFKGAGVLQLVNNQQTGPLGIKDFSRTFGALRDYGVTDIYCCKAALEQYRLSAGDLLLGPEAVTASEIQAMLREHKQVLTF